MARIGVPLLALFGMAACLAPAVLAGDEMTFAKDHLAIETASGQRYPFDVELAVTPAQRAHGLMFRKQLAPDAGMLFLFDRAAPRTFWMKNTYLPLDIIFIGADGRIVSIARDTTPLTETPIPSGAPALGVLEVNAGTAERLGLAAGDRVLHRAFGS
jgi:uncharacterized membrane protein (UPF0127 family)